MSDANQKSIYINRDKVNTQGGRRYLLVYTDNLNIAYQKMEGKKCFGLYLYLLERMPHFYNGEKINSAPKQFELSAVAVNNEIGMSRTTYNRAVEELINLGFLELLQGNTYIFHEMPKQYRPQTIQEYEEEKIITIEETEKIMKERQREQIKQSIEEKTSLWDNLKSDC